MSIQYSTRPGRRVVQVIAILGVAALPLGAQGIVQGTVTDAHAGSPISDVTVFVAGARRGAVTDAQGRYHIAAVPAGAQKLIAQRVGYGVDTLDALVAD